MDESLKNQIFYACFNRLWPFIACFVPFLMYVTVKDTRIYLILS